MKSHDLKKALCQWTAMPVSYTHLDVYKRQESVRNVEGVLAVSLVYHQQEEQGEETP